MWFCGANLSEAASLTNGQEMMVTFFGPRDFMLQYFTAVFARAVMRATRAQVITTPSRSYQNHYKQPFVTISKARCPIKSTGLTETASGTCCKVSSPLVR